MADLTSAFGRGSADDFFEGFEVAESEFSRVLEGEGSSRAVSEVFGFEAEGGGFVPGGAEVEVEAAVCGGMGASAEVEALVGEGGLKGETGEGGLNFEEVGDFGKEGGRAVDGGVVLG